MLWHAVSQRMSLVTLWAWQAWHLATCQVSCVYWSDLPRCRLQLHVSICQLTTGRPCRSHMSLQPV